MENAVEILDQVNNTELTQQAEKVDTQQMESKLFIKINEEESNIDFTFFIPKNCSYEHAKKGALATYEHIVRLENEAIRLQAKSVEEGA